LRLGQRVLATGNGGGGRIAAAGQIEAGGAKVFERFERSCLGGHEGKVSERESGKANGSDKQHGDLAELLQ
ncbi:hypothetical protein, partial [Mesorhizobium sp.]|uniref:hypothetical protein n=1 Tax=Mesorhizobium sp. TaxID=1871066 RepID=UPI0025C115D3